MQTQDKEPREESRKSSDEEFTLFGEFSDFEGPEWETLMEEGRYLEQEQRSCEECGLRAVSESLEEFPPQLKNIVEVRFKGTRRAFYENDQNVEVVREDAVFVEADKGIDLGIVHLTGELVQVKRRAKGILYREEKKLLRKASAGEKAVLDQLRLREEEAFEKCRARILQHNLPMKLVDVEYQFDGNRVTFYYTADHRVDFRALVKDLASIFRTRIEMRQIGVREEAKSCGGLGICGRELCCASWISYPRRITVWFAKVQSLSTNPARLTGKCGRLKCCLAFEVDGYIDALKEFPAVRTIIRTERGSARVEKVDIVGRTVSVQYLETDYREKLSLEQVNDYLRRSSLQSA